MPTVRLRGPLMRVAGDRAEHQVEGGTVVELLAELERAHPAARGWMLDERGVLRRHINVFVNGELCAQETPVDAGDRIEVIPAISGGCDDGPRRIACGQPVSPLPHPSARA